MITRILIGVGLLVFSVSSHAAVIQQFQSFSTSGGAIQSDVFTLDPFDTSLGTLDNVRVAIDGQVSITGTGQGIVPFDLRLGLDFHGLAGQFFDFSDPGIQLIYQGILPYQSCSIAGCVPVFGPLLIPPTTLSLDFSFDREFQELSGIEQGFIDDFTVTGVSGASPPTVISGSINDFHETLAGIDQMQLLVTTDIVAGQVTSFAAVTGGSILVIYDYSPLDVSAIPVPSAVWLFGTAILGLIGFGRRKKLSLAD